MSVGTIQKYDVTRNSRKGNVIISPSINGITDWDLTTTPLSISSYGEYTITPQSDINIFVKMWGAAGGSTGYSTFSSGAGGGYSEGNMTLFSGSSYVVIVGEAGEKAISPDGARVTVSGGGGGASAIVINDSPVFVAGGGGGAGTYPTYYAGAGGGSSGQNALQGPGGKGGTQTAPGDGGHGDRRDGDPGSGPNGGKGAPVTAPSFSSGGRGYGKGGDGVYFYADGPSGGGGGGYFGGGGGGGAAGGWSGGGGSGYLNPSLVTNGVTTTGDHQTPANSEDPDRGNSGATVDTIPQDGKIIISLA